jgi:2-keto-4-pentenoate hydratase/2-oxohepta-3-ene-1,7-dioic acid hydratase in catechol pathway
MKLVRFVDPDGQTIVGQPTGPQTARPITGQLFHQWQLADREVTIARTLPPVDPPNIFAIGRNYLAHAQETGSRVPENPLIFSKPTTAIIGHEDTIRLPAPAPDHVDFEAELAIIIARPARNVPESNALEFVLGYTCANDVSARDCQRNDKQWVRAKGFDTFCPLGPCLVTADSLDPDNCAIRSRLNGDRMQDGHTSRMIHPCRKLISYLSHQFTLLPGTIILTGTPEGVGFARQPPVFLKSSDRIEVEIDGIGTLANPVQATPV